MAVVLGACLPFLVCEGLLGSMRKGLMQDYANPIAQMFVGYQITLVDIPRLVTIGRGQIEVDLFSGVTTIDNKSTSPFSISEAVTSWYKDAVLRDVLDEAFIRTFVLFAISTSMNLLWTPNLNAK